MTGQETDSFARTNNLINCKHDIDTNLTFFIFSIQGEQIPLTRSSKSYFQSPLQETNQFFYTFKVELKIINNILINI